MARMEMDCTLKKMHSFSKFQAIHRKIIQKLLWLALPAKISLEFILLVL